MLSSKTAVTARRKKLARYHMMLKKIDSWTDGLGEGVDSQIRKTVALLNLLGHRTAMSCEGHLDPHRGAIAPWVDVEIQSKERELKTRKLVRAYWHYLGEKQAPDITAMWMYDSVKGRLRIQAGPDHFYLSKEKPNMPLVVRK